MRASSATDKGVLVVLRGTMVTTCYCGWSDNVVTVCWLAVGSTELVARRWMQEKWSRTVELDDLEFKVWKIIGMVEQLNTLQRK